MHHCHSPRSHPGSCVYFCGGVLDWNGRALPQRVERVTQRHTLGHGNHSIPHCFLHDTSLADQGLFIAASSGFSSPLGASPLRMTLHRSRSWPPSHASGARVAMEPTKFRRPRTTGSLFQVPLSATCTTPYFGVNYPARYLNPAFLALCHVLLLQAHIPSNISDRSEHAL